MDSAELSQLRASFHADLRDFVNFFDAGGVDHEHGSFCCGLSHKGERISGTKFIWFNGRGAWVYSRLHNTGVLKEEKAPRAGQSMSDYLLGVAKGAVNFILSHGRDASGGVGRRDRCQRQCSEAGRGQLHSDHGLRVRFHRWKGWPSTP